jgi:magnesium chelatase family protein
MLARLVSATIVGVEAALVDVEVDVASGLPAFVLVGLPDAAVRESRDRVRSAIRHSGFDFPLARITVNLSPADVRKNGTAFDLPVALGVLAAAGLVSITPGGVAITGELALDGRVLPVPGVLSVALAARRHGIRTLVVPAQNATEAALAPGADVIAVATLAEAAIAVGTPDAAPRFLPGGHVRLRPHPLEIADVRGQPLAKRALEIAAAGGHHALLIGPPGVGKSMLARRLPSLLPDWSFEDAVEATAIHSVAGLLTPSVPVLMDRPFRAPHHTASVRALAGGGAPPRPGEVSLAHHGVLFLDELPEFDRHALEVLRQPLEEGHVTVARATQSVRFPARFQLVAAMNPCPCGFSGSPTRPCRCTPLQVRRYRARVSGPLWDRLDLIVPVGEPAAGVVVGTCAAGDTSAVVKERVREARARQALAGRIATSNSRLEGRELRAACALPDDAERDLLSAVRRLALSARGQTRVLRVARTLADLAGRERIDLADLREALQFRETCL